MKHQAQMHHAAQPRALRRAGERWMTFRASRWLKRKTATAAKPSSEALGLLQADQRHSTMLGACLRPQKPAFEGVDA